MLFRSETTYDFKDYIANIEDIIDIKEFHVSGVGHNIIDDRFHFELNVKGMLILECARTLVEVPFLIDVQTIEVFDKVIVGDEDVWLIEKNTIDLKDVVWETILLQKPIRVISPLSEGREEE